MFNNLTTYFIYIIKDLPVYSLLENRGNMYIVVKTLTKGVFSIKVAILNDYITYDFDYDFTDKKYYVKIIYQSIVKETVMPFQTIIASEVYEGDINEFLIKTITDKISTLQFINTEYNKQENIYISEFGIIKERTK